MKVIFLDIDGVLNSVAYDRERGADGGNIDVSRLPYLKRLVDETGAKIVLSSSWRKHLGQTSLECDAIGLELTETFRAAGLDIYSKTPILGERAEEISAWLDCHPEVTGYVIIDDAFGGWGKHTDCLVATNSRIGRGIGEAHILKALEILK